MAVLDDKTCPSCGSVNNKDNVFCINCGAKLPELSKESSSEVTQVSESDLPKVADTSASPNSENELKVDEAGRYTCPICKRPLPPGNKFCINCNQSIDGSLESNQPFICVSCGTVLKPTDSFCTNCGVKVVNPLQSLPSSSEGHSVYLGDYNFHRSTPDQMLNSVVLQELTELGENKNVSVPGLEKKKNIFAIIYAVIVFFCVCLIFFHAHYFWIFFTLIVATIIDINIVRKYDIVRYLSKEIKSRPDEKMSYIIASVLSGKTNGTKGKVMRLGFLVVALVLPLIIFREPMLIYERQGEDYVVRFYTFGAFKNDKVLEIPEEHNGRDVVGIRGDVFAHVRTIEKVVLPKTIREIRGGAFAYATNLREINLPKGITEVKGDTFRGCYKLKEIVIPEGVTRIGGSAFRDCISLQKADIPESVREIGSSAFRNTALRKVCYSKHASVDARAFKDNVGLNRYYYEDGCTGKYGSYYE